MHPLILLTTEHISSCKRFILSAQGRFVVRVGKEVSKQMMVSVSCNSPGQGQSGIGGILNFGYEVSCLLFPFR